TNLSAQRHQPTPQRISDPHLSRAPVRRHKRRRHHADHRIDLPQLPVQTLLPILTNTDPVMKVAVKKRIMTS
ncbi:MAG: hypothetical protein M3441_29180, partial [Chloroflexota bacterium]|nr:hypothetical protein [Chloroflexota bacterium]